jgi:hypothetical protein
LHKEDLLILLVYKTTVWTSNIGYR